MSGFRDVTEEEARGDRMDVAMYDFIQFFCLCDHPGALHTPGFPTQVEVSCPACGRVYRLVLRVQEPEAV